MEGRIIVITSGKGGVGKTTATASIGTALAMEGRRVAVVDMDIGLRNLDVMMGLENRIVFNIVDAVHGRCQLRQAAIRDRRIKNLFLIPASQSDNKNVLTPEDMIRFCKKLRSAFDFVLMDCPAGIEQGFENTVAGADDAIVICTPEVASVRDADRVIGLLYARSITPRLVINRIIPDMVENGDMLSHDDVLDVLSIELIGLVQMDDRVIVATNTGTPLILQKGSAAGESFQRIAKRLNGQYDLPIIVPIPSKSIWKTIGTRFGIRK